ncbi:MAG: DNA primase, partial [Chloroflexi bacterium]|nr:DNA primase [Chloroflexota bacterium]
MAVTDDIKARVDIVDVVSQYVPELKKSGRNFTARCPFHQERTPSFVVFPERQSWRCFGACAVGGDVFSFVMKADNVAFPQAMRSLAERAGVTVPERRRPDAPRNPIYDVNEAALRFFRDALTADRGAMARSYAERRQLGEQAIVTFGIGYAPSGGDELLKSLGALGFAEELLLAAGVVTRVQSGDVRDMLRGRLVFTLRNADGDVVGFAGRSLDGGDPKYINTPQTPVFDKGKMLYGFDRAKSAIAREGVAVVVEGYTDVIAAHEHGYENVVASMGTALTGEQVALLGAHAQQIV